MDKPITLPLAPGQILVADHITGRIYVVQTQGCFTVVRRPED